MGWYTDYTLVVEVDYGNLDLAELQKTFKDERTAKKVTEICCKCKANCYIDYWCGLGNLQLELTEDKNIKLTTTTKRGGFSDLQFLVVLVLYVLGTKVKKIDASLAGEDGYAEMNLLDECMENVPKKHSEWLWSIGGREIHYVRQSQHSGQRECNPVAAHTQA